MRSWLFALILALALIPPTAGRSAAAENAQYFPQTGQWVEGSFLTFFDQHGGLDLFGYPRTERLWRHGRFVQYFQRARFESWPENSPAFQVQLGLLGDEVTGPADPPIPVGQVPAPGDPTRTYFPQTGHTLSSAFRDYFDTRGGLAIFGYPTSEPFASPSGFLVQRFQRARMELHPELPPSYQVSLGLLGDEAIYQQGQIAATTTEPVSAAAPPDAAPLPSGRLVMMQSAGGNLVEAKLGDAAPQVVGQGIDPSWSPDGKKIAYAFWGPDPGVYVVNADGSGRKQVFSGDGARAPVWSPDGQSIAFYHRYPGFPGQLQGNQIVYPDFFQVVVVSLADGSTWLPMEQPYHAYAPSWSPDGTTILFQGDKGLYLAPLRQIARLIPNTDDKFTTPTWSPDGSTIAFTYLNHDHWDIGLIHPDGSGMQLLTYDSTFAPAPNNASATWSPDGSQLLFASDRAGGWGLYLIGTDGAGLRPLAGPPFTYDGSNERVVDWKS